MHLIRTAKERQAADAAGRLHRFLAETTVPRPGYPIPKRRAILSVFRRDPEFLEMLFIRGLDLETLDEVARRASGEVKAKRISREIGFGYGIKSHRKSLLRDAALQLIGTYNTAEMYKEHRLVRFYPSTRKRILGLTDRLYKLAKPGRVYLLDEFDLIIDGTDGWVRGRLMDIREVMQARIFGERFD